MIKFYWMSCSFYLVRISLAVFYEVFSDSFFCMMFKARFWTVFFVKFYCSLRRIIELWDGSLTRPPIVFTRSIRFRVECKFVPAWLMFRFC